MTLPLFLDGHKVDPSLLSALWTSNGSDVASIGEAPSQIKDGFGWDDRDLVSGDFSLTVLGARLGLQGVYECTVSYNSTTLHSSNATLSVLGGLLLRLDLHILGFAFQHQNGHFFCLVFQRPPLCPSLSGGWCWKRRVGLNATQAASTLLPSLSPGPGTDA